MNKKMAVALFVGLAALYAGLLMQSIVGAAASAVLALAMCFSDIFPFNDGHPSRIQQAVAFVLILVFVASYVLQAHYQWAQWFTGLVGGIGDSFITLAAIGLFLSGWET